MRPVLLALILSAGTLGAPAHAGSAIENACLSAGRNAASRELCGCIQQVADAVLSPGEQKRGAKLFADPHLSQELRVSRRDTDMSFWQKWQAFSATAAQYCE
jgi:hypothetical protein